MQFPAFLTRRCGAKQRPAAKQRFGARRGSASPRQRRRASALVETALCLTFVLLPVTLGGFQFAMVFMTQHALQQVSRESARWAAVHFKDSAFDGAVTVGDPVPLRNGANQVVKDALGNPVMDMHPPRSLLNFVRAQALSNGISWQDINGSVLRDGRPGGSIMVTPTNPALRDVGRPLTLTITYPMRQRAFLGSLFFKPEDNGSSALNLGVFKNNYAASSTMIMEGFGS